MLCRSQAIEWHVREILAHDTERSAFFYCIRRGEVASSRDTILCSLLAQLAESIDGSSIADVVKREYEENKPGKMRVDICKILLGDLIRTYQRTTIFIDALDECEEPPRLLIDLAELHKLGGGKVKFFLSSRPCVEIDRDFPFWEKIDLNAREELTTPDVQIYVETQIKKRKELGLGPRLCEKFRTDIEEQINESLGDKELEHLKEKLRQIELLESRLIDVLIRRSRGM